MLNIAIVDDDELFANQISDFIQKIHGDDKEYKITYHNRPLDFIENYKPNYQIVFLDVEMPLMDGFSVARRIRGVDNSTIVIFVTKLAQYAIKGYEVNALDYIVKPFSFYDFALKYERAVSIVKAKENEGFCIHQNDGFVKVNVNDITYVEVSGHHCRFHTKDNVYEAYMTLSSVKERLSKYHFLQCNGYCIVNPRSITSMDANNIYINKECIPISRPRKREFKKELTEWLGEYSA